MTGNGRLVGRKAITHDGMLDSGVKFGQKPFTPDTLTRKVREVLAADTQDGDI